MQNLSLFKFHFTTPLHIHQDREDYANSSKSFHSDKLYAAIMQAWATLGMDEELNKIGKKENEEGTMSFTLSSLFPFTRVKAEDKEETQKFVYFLPRPLKSFDDTTKEFEEAYKGKMKVLKGIKWFDLDYFTKQVQQKKGCFPKPLDIHDDFLTSRKIDTDFTKSQIVPRIAIDRVTGESNPFYFDKIWFEEGSGMYCLAEGDKDTLIAIYIALKFLGDEGIGSDRNVGFGRFKISMGTQAEVEKFKILIQPSQDTLTYYYTNLSLFNPEGNEKELQSMIEDEKVGFEWIKRGGWITSEPNLTYRKQSVYMFKEGSVFKFSTSPNEKGYTLNVRPPIAKGNHPIWRVGRSFFVPIQF